MSSLVPFLCLAALFGLAAFALRPPAFIPWPGYRWTGQDPARFRVMVAGWVTNIARNELADEKAKVALLRRQLADRDARIVKLTDERDEADARAAAPSLLGDSDGVTLRIAVVRPGADDDESARGAASATGLAPGR